MSHPLVFRVALRLALAALLALAPFLPTHAQSATGSRLGSPQSGAVPANAPVPAGAQGEHEVGCPTCPGAVHCPTEGELGLACPDAGDVFVDPCLEPLIGDCADPDPCPCEDTERLTYRNSYGPQVGPWSVEPAPLVHLPLPQFNPDLGELKSIELEVRLDILNARFEIENRTLGIPCASPITSWSIDGRVTLSRIDDHFIPPLLDLSDTIIGDFPMDLGPFDGSIDFEGSSGDTVLGSDSCVYRKFCITEGGADCLPLQDFVGTACIDFYANGDSDNQHEANCDDVVLGFYAEEQVTLQVTYVYCPNMPPVACPDQAPPVCPESCVLVDVLANDCDPDCDSSCTEACDGVAPRCFDDARKVIDPASIQFCIDGDENNTTPGPLATTYGVATVVDGQIRYCPNPGAYDVRMLTPDVLYYRVADGEGCYSECAQVDLSILPKPVAEPDDTYTCEGECVLIDLLQNDTPQGNDDPLANIDPESLEICVEPGMGDVYLPGEAGGEGLPPGWVRYCPGPGCDYTATFTYKVSNGYGCMSECATVSVLVKCPPEVLPDFDEVCAGRTVTLDVLANDEPYMDRDILPSTVMLCSAPADCGGSCGPVGGEPTVHADGRISFAADPAFRGTGYFYYRVADKNGCISDCARVEVEVIPAPIAVADCYEFDEDPLPAEIVICVLDNDLLQGQPIPLPSPYTIEICTQPQFGMAIGPADIDQATGCITYRPTMRFGDLDSFSYRLLNPNVEECDSECVEVQVKRRLCPPYNRRTAGSLLLYPEFDNRPGSRTILTVTNVSRDSDARVEVRYIGSDDCLHVSRFVNLTPNETFTTYTATHNPEQEQGYAYAFALETVPNGQPIVSNHLIGQLVTVDGVNMFDFGVNAVSFKGVGQEGALTDVDMDGIRDLNGEEYQEAPDEIWIPRFLGQDAGFQSQLILINLTGGVAFTTQVGFLVYNDNEEEFSFGHTFYCWERRPLLELSDVFGNDWLKTFSAHDPGEILGQESRESGWIKLNGTVASSSFKDILDPAIYAVLVEIRNDQGTWYAAADLPWEICVQDNGSLLPKSLHGDNED